MRQGRPQRAPEQHCRDTGAFNNRSTSGDSDAASTPYGSTLPTDDDGVESQRGVAHERRTTIGHISAVTVPSSVAADSFDGHLPTSRRPPASHLAAANPVTASSASDFSNRSTSLLSVEAQGAVRRGQHVSQGSLLTTRYDAIAAYVKRAGLVSFRSFVRLVQGCNLNPTMEVIEDYWSVVVEGQVDVTYANPDRVTKLIHDVGGVRTEASGPGQGAAGGGQSPSRSRRGIPPPPPSTSSVEDDDGGEAVIRAEGGDADMPSPSFTAPAVSPAQAPHTHQNTQLHAEESDSAFVGPPRAAATTSPRQQRHRAEGLAKRKALATSQTQPMRFGKPTVELTPRVDRPAATTPSRRTSTPTTSSAAAGAGNPRSYRTLSTTRQPRVRTGSPTYDDWRPMRRASPTSPLLHPRERPYYATSTALPRERAATPGLSPHHRQKRDVEVASMYERMFQRAKQDQTRLAERRRELEQEKLEACTFQPHINHSRRVRRRSSTDRKGDSGSRYMRYTESRYRQYQAMATTTTSDAGLGGTTRSLEATITRSEPVSRARTPPPPLADNVLPARRARSGDGKRRGYVRYGDDADEAKTTTSEKALAECTFHPKIEELHGPVKAGEPPLGFYQCIARLRRAGYTRSTSPSSKFADSLRTEPPRQPFPWLRSHSTFGEERSTRIRSAPVSPAGIQKITGAAALGLLANSDENVPPVARAAVSTRHDTCVGAAVRAEQAEHSLALTEQEARAILASAVGPAQDDHQLGSLEDEQNPLFHHGPLAFHPKTSSAKEAVRRLVERRTINQDDAPDVAAAIRALELVGVIRKTSTRMNHDRRIVAHQEERAMEHSAMHQRASRAVGRATQRERGKRHPSVPRSREASPTSATVVPRYAQPRRPTVLVD